MNDLPIYLRYALRILLWVGPLEFLLGRVISRAARQAPAGELMGLFFNTASDIGAFLVGPAMLLVLAVLVCAAVLGRRAGAAEGSEIGPGWPRLLGPLLLGLMAFSAGLLFGEPSAPILVGYDLISAAVIVGIGVLVVSSDGTPVRVRVTMGLFAAAYAFYYVYAILGSFAQAANSTALGDARIWVNAIGEAFAMAAAISLLWTAGPLSPTLRERPLARRFKWLRLVFALLPAIFFAISVNFETWLQSVTTQFTVGFTLFLPVPITALAFAAYMYALLTCFSRTAAEETGLPWSWEIGAGLLLLPVAGYQLQLSYQHLMLAVVFLLLSGLIRPFSRVGATSYELRATSYELRDSRPSH